MSLLSVILALLAESFITSLPELRRFDVFSRYVAWLRSKLPVFSYQNGVVTLLIVVAGVAFTVWLLSAMLGNVLQLFAFIFGVAVLVFCLGPRDLEQDVQKVITAFERGDYESANLYASKLSGYDLAEEPLQLAQTVKENILIQVNTRVLGVFFWFIVLGPVGAVLFRVSCLLKEAARAETDDFATAAHDFYDIMLWVPARISVLSYAIAGNFIDTMSYWNGLSDLWQRESEDFIVVSGIGSLRYESRIERRGHEEDDEPDVSGIQHALSLVKRAVIVWVVLLALLTVTGWLF